MSINAVAVTVPVSNDVILGEFKAYLNYGLPSQILLGATREGCKVTLMRKIKEIGYAGAYGYTINSDGDPLVRYEEFEAQIKIKALYLKYFNKKKISDCESADTWISNDWGATGGTYTAETTQVLEGDQSAKCTADTLDYGISNPFASAKDLTAFDNAEVSADSDYIGFAIYVSTQDKADMGSANIQIGLHMDAIGTETNQYTYDIAPSVLNADQWTSFKVLKSAFTEVGSGDWSAVTGVSFKLDLQPTAEVEFFVDSIDLIQDTSDSSIIPINGATFNYTDETSYKEYTPSLEVLDSDFVENVTLLGQRMDGKMVKIIQKNALSDGKIELALENKDELVNEVQFSAHYKQIDPLGIPILIREYV